MAPQNPRPSATALAARCHQVCLLHLHLKRAENTAAPNMQHWSRCWNLPRWRAGAPAQKVRQHHGHQTAAPQTLRMAAVLKVLHLTRGKAALASNIGPRIHLSGRGVTETETTGQDQVLRGPGAGGHHQRHPPDAAALSNKVRPQIPLSGQGVAVMGAAGQQQVLRGPGGGRHHQGHPPGATAPASDVAPQLRPRKAACSVIFSF